MGATTNPDSLRTPVRRSDNLHGPRANHSRSQCRASLFNSHKMADYHFCPERYHLFPHTNHRCWSPGHWRRKPHGYREESGPGRPGLLAYHISSIRLGGDPLSYAAGEESDIGSDPEPATELEEVYVGFVRLVCGVGDKKSRPYDSVRGG